VPIPAKCHFANSFAICEPYLDLKKLSRGGKIAEKQRRFPGEAGEKKKPTLKLAWAFS